MRVALVFVLCVAPLLTFGANPNYSYHVKIDDPAHANFQEKAEARKGPNAQGFYSVVEPNGALRTVEYTADDRGFNPIVTYSHGHAGSSSAVYQSLGGTYAPAFVSDKRVQIVDKLTGSPPLLNIQPFALPVPSFGPGGPVVVPAPLRAAPAPHLIAEAHGVNYAPAFMPPVTAFAEPSRTYLPAVAEPSRTYLPAPPQQVAYQQPQLQQQIIAQPLPQQQVFFNAPPPQKVLYNAPPPQKVLYQPQQVLYNAPPPQKVLYQAPPQQVIYNAPPPQKVIYNAPPPQQVIYEAPRPALVQLPQPQSQIVFKAPQPAVIAVQKKVLQPATPVVIDSYSVAPTNTVTDPNAQTYPDAVKVVKKPLADYGLPEVAPGTPLGLENYNSVPVKPVLQLAQPIIKVHQPQPQLQVFAQPQPQLFARPAPVQVLQPQVQVAAPVKVLQQQAPVLGLYAGAIGYHTHSASPTSYLHSYGTQGFQVTSSRNFNKAVLPVPVLQKQLIQQQGVASYAPQYYQQAHPIKQIVQHAPQTFIQPAPQPFIQPAPQPFIQPAPQPFIQPAPQPFIQPAPQPFIQPAPQPFIQPAPQTFIQPAPVPSYAQPPQIFVKQPSPAGVAAVPIGTKNPLTFAYSYDQGSSKVSHSYSGRGW